jgi:hypothetical protein
MSIVRNMFSLIFLSYSTILTCHLLNDKDTVYPYYKQSFITNFRYFTILNIIYGLFLTRLTIRSGMTKLSHFIMSTSAVWMFFSIIHIGLRWFWVNLSGDKIEAERIDIIPYPNLLKIGDVMTYNVLVFLIFVFYEVYIFITHIVSIIFLSFLYPKWVCNVWSNMPKLMKLPFTFISHIFSQ